MDQPHPKNYYLTRANVSRDRARRASAPAIAAIHLELAGRYEELAVHLSDVTDPVRRDRTG